MYEENGANFAHKNHPTVSHSFACLLYAPAPFVRDTLLWIVTFLLHLLFHLAASPIAPPSILQSSRASQSFWQVWPLIRSEYASDPRRWGVNPWGKLKKHCCPIEWQEWAMPVRIQLENMEGRDQWELKGRRAYVQRWEDLSWERLQSREKEGRYLKTPEILIHLLVPVLIQSYDKSLFSPWDRRRELLLLANNTHTHSIK